MHQSSDSPWFYISYECAGDKNARKIAHALTERYGEASVFFDDRDSDQEKELPLANLTAINQAKVIVLVDAHKAEVKGDEGSLKSGYAPIAGWMASEARYFLDSGSDNLRIIDLDMRVGPVGSNEVLSNEITSNKKPSDCGQTDKSSRKSRAKSNTSVNSLKKKPAFAYYSSIHCYDITEYGREFIRRGNAFPTLVEFYNKLFSQIEALLEFSEDFLGFNPYFDHALSTRVIVDIQEAIEKKVKTLDLSGAHLDKIPYGLRLIPGLKKLNLSSDESEHELSVKKSDKRVALTSLAGLEANTKLEILDVSGRQFLGNFQALQELTSLRELDASNTSFSDATVIDMPLGSLRSININHTHCPLGQALAIDTLTSLSMANAEVKDLSALIKTSKLEYLNLGGNLALADIQPLVQQGHSNLVEINLSHTGVKTIDALAELPELQRVDIGSTNVTSIAALKAWLEKLKPHIVAESISKLDQHDNWLVASDCRQLIEPPLDRLRRGAVAIVEYFDGLERDRAASIADFVNREARLLIIGNSTSGKSHIAQHLINRTNTSRQKAYKKIYSTHGMQVHRWKLAKRLSEKLHIEDAVVSILDFGGQDYYHHCHPMFFNVRTCYLVVWEASTNQSGPLPTSVTLSPGDVQTIDIQHNAVEYWLETIAHFIRIRSTHTFRISTLTHDYTKRLELQGRAVPFDYEPTFDSTTESEIIAADTSFRELEDLLRELPIMNGLQPNVAEATVQGLLNQAKLDLYRSTSVILVQNKVDRDGRCHLNLKEIVQEYPFVIDSVAVSALKGTRMDVLQNELIPEALESLDLVGEIYPGHYRTVLDWMATSDEFSVSVDTIKQQLDNATPTSAEQTQSNVWDFLQTAYHLGVAVPATNALHRTDRDYGNPSTHDRLSKSIFVKPYELIGVILNILSRDLLEQNGRFDRDYVIAHAGMKEIDSILDIMKTFKIIVDDTRDQQNDGHHYIAPQYINHELPTGFSFAEVFLDKPIVRYRFANMIHPSMLLELYALLSNEQYLSEQQVDPENKGKITFSRHTILIATQHQPSVGMLIVDMERQDINILSDQGFNRTTLVDTLCRAVEQVGSQLAFSKEVTVDGQCYVPLSKLMRFEQQPVQLFDHEGQIHQLGKFRQFLPNMRDKLLMKKLFISYSSKDKPLMEQLLVHLKVLERNNLVSTWHDGEIQSGMDWDATIKAELHNADIVLLLLSPDFLNSEYIWNEEVQLALHLVKGGNCDKLVVPIVLRSCGWLETSLCDIQAAGKVPRKGEPIVLAKDIDEAWQSVVTDLIVLIRGNALGAV